MQQFNHPVCYVSVQECREVVDKVCGLENREVCKVIKNKKCHTLKQSVRTTKKFNKCVWPAPSSNNDPNC